MILEIGEVKSGKIFNNSEIAMEVTIFSPRLKVRWLCLTFDKNNHLWFLNIDRKPIWVFYTFFLRKYFSGFSVSVEIENPENLKGGILVAFEDIRILPGGNLISRQPLKFIKEVAAIV